MSSFKPGPISQWAVVERPVWPELDAAAWSPPPADESLQGRLNPEGGAGMASNQALTEAQLQAAQILEEAAAQAEAALAATRKQGLEQGHREGLAAGQAELEQQRQQSLQLMENARVQADLTRKAAEAEVKAQLASTEAQAQAILANASAEAATILAEARREQHRRLDEAQDALVNLAVAAAVRLVQGHLALQPSAVVAMVAAGLRRLKDTNCSVRVSPGDLPLLEAQRSILERELGAGLLQLQPDHSLSQGSYLLGSPQGQIDARIEQQALHMHTALNVALGGYSE